MLMTPPSAFTFRPFWSLFVKELPVIGLVTFKIPPARACSSRPSPVLLSNVMPFKSSIVKEALATMIFRPSPPLLVNAFALNAELPMMLLCTVSVPPFLFSRTRPSPAPPLATLLATSNRLIVPPLAMTSKARPFGSVPFVAVLSDIVALMMAPGLACKLRPLPSRSNVLLSIDVGRATSVGAMALIFPPFATTSIPTPRSSAPLPLVSSARSKAPSKSMSSPTSNWPLLFVSSD